MPGRFMTRWRSQQPAAPLAVAIVRRWQASSGSILRRWTARCKTLAPLVLLISAAAQFTVTYLLPPDFLDLHVYVLGGAALDRPGMLYHFVYTDQTPLRRCHSRIRRSRRSCSIRCIFCRSAWSRSAG